MCGTDTGYRRHFKEGTPTCDDCRAAHARRRREQRWKSGQCQPKRDPECGTIGGYQAHFRRDEPACRECVEAQNLYSRRWRRRRSDPVSINECIVDALSTQDRWLPRDILVSLILDLHSEWKPGSIVTAVYRLAAKQVVDMRIVMGREGQSDRAEYRAGMEAWEKL